MSVTSNVPNEVGSVAGGDSIGPIGLTVRLSGDRLIVAGDVDLATTSKVDTAVLAWSKDGDLTLDFSRVDFIDAFGLGRLVAMQRALSRAGSRLRIVGASPQIHRTFVLGGVEGLLERRCCPDDLDEQPDVVERGARATRQARLPLHPSAELDTP